MLLLQNMVLTANVVLTQNVVRMADTVRTENVARMADTARTENVARTAEDKDHKKERENSRSFFIPLFGRKSLSLRPAKTAIPSVQILSVCFHVSSKT